MSRLKEILDISQGSDIYIADGAVPIVRQNGQVRPIKGYKPLTAQMCFEIKQDILLDLSQKQKDEFLKRRQISFAYQKGEQDRYRVYMHQEGDHIEIHLHHIPFLIPTIKDLGLPKNISEIAEYTEGLILISGPAGSGRSTTAASLIQHWNQTRSIYLVTLEKVLEYQIESQKSLIYQREVHKNYKSTVESLLKKNIDACFLSDVYSAYDYLALLDVCVSGSLVMATTFANSAIDTIEQFLGNAKSDASWTAKRLSIYLKAIIHQRLVPGKQGQPVLVAEILLPTAKIRKLIQDQDLDPIYNLMREDQHRTGMISLNQSLMNVLIKRKIELRTAFSVSPNPNELDQLLKRVGI